MMQALIQTSTPDTATGEIQKGYEIFNKRGVDMPDPMRLMSASPGYFGIMLQRNIYYSNHPNLSFSLLAHIRYFASCRLDYSFCRIFNKKMLAKMGVSKEDFTAMSHDPEKSLLEDNEKHMLLFVLKAMEKPEAVTAQDIEALRNEGWTDSDIFDGLAQGVGMMDHNIFMRVFKPEHKNGL